MTATLHPHLHLDVVILVWLAIGVVGVALCLDAIGYARRDLALVRAIGARDRRASTRELDLETALVRGDVVSAFITLTLELANVAVGLLALLQAPPPHGRTLLGWAIVSLLIFGAATAPVRLYLQRRRRQRLLAL